MHLALFTQLFLLLFAQAGSTSQGGKMAFIGAAETTVGTPETTGRCESRAQWQVKM